MLVGGAHRALALSSLAKVAITASEADDAGVLHVFHFRRNQDCAPCIRHTLRCPGVVSVFSKKVYACFAFPPPVSFFTSLTMILMMDMPQNTLTARIPNPPALTM